MNEATPRFWQVFFELYESLPRQGPGNRASAEKARALCDDLPQGPVVLDLGCGVGAQTIYLAGILPGSVITAVDNHAPSLERLQREVNERGLTGRVRPLLSDMASPGLKPESFDLIWSEGALYNIGVDPALQLCQGLLRPGGYLVFTDAVWSKEDPPPEVKESFDLDYPAMGRVSDVEATIERSSFSLLHHFTLPEEAWWEEFYTPMERRIEELRVKYSGDAEALDALEQLAQEPEMHRRCGDSYDYEFFVTKRGPGPIQSTGTGASG